MSKSKALRAAVIALSILAAIVVVRMQPGTESRPLPTAAAATPPSPTTSSSTRAAAGDATPSTDRRRGSSLWQKRARSFISRYPNTRGGKAAWLGRLRPVVSDDLYSSLKTVRLANIPSGTFGPGEVQQTAEVGGVMRFPLRHGDVAAVDVTVSATDQGRLRVTGFEPVTSERGQ
ncbi:hypothetical protein [Janibacter terrae]|uniref:hypothetical protein n=1 Tax=Janibacter terrae TaxID=103817 RepID=UPI0031F7BA5B